MKKTPNTIIESLGTYLPPDSFSTREILDGCKNRIRFPLEKISGIKNRRMAGQEEFSIDLARKAVADCLKNSKYQAEEIDALVCCNISRVDGPDRLSFEPGTSVKLRKHFGLKNALVFDITNACAGMFTGIHIVNNLLATGAIRCGMVVSGEYITHLTQTAQEEITGFMDSRMACLTLGDAGAALILEKSPNDQQGFQQLDLHTFGRYSPYCTAQLSETGSWIMYTDSVNLTDVAIKSGAEHSLAALDKANWQPDSFEHLIMHQTSKLTLNSARKEINKLLDSPVFDDENTVNNLEERGNTASTAHFIALADKIRDSKIQSGDKVAFGISASGLTIGTALYVLDDLPDRMRLNGSAKPVQREKAGRVVSPKLPGVRIASVGILGEESRDVKGTMELAKQAAGNCLKSSKYQPNDIDLLIYSGVYRENYLMEPAYAALLAGELSINATASKPEDKKTLAFDIFNGSIGFLNACHTAQQMLASGSSTTAMIVAAEHENNAENFVRELTGIAETASALILDLHPESDKGFSSFHFRHDETLIDQYTSDCDTTAVARLVVAKADNLESQYIQSILPTVQEFLDQEGISLGQVDLILPPQISSGFIKDLSSALGQPVDKFVNALKTDTDLFSSSLPVALNHALQTGLAKPGSTALIMAVGSGIQTGCALYHF
ncbi:MAG: hypothetical protein Roseis2KO_04070 [Roseivirga sp.]